MNKYVRIQAPKTLLQSYKIARLQEEVFEAQAQSWGITSFPKDQGPILPTPTLTKLQYFQRNSYPNSTFKKPLESTSNKFTRFPNNSVIKRLSTTEMDEKRSKGLCFFYDEKYVIGHNCRGQNNYILKELQAEIEGGQIEELWAKTNDLWLYHNRISEGSLVIKL